MSDFKEELDSGKPKAGQSGAFRRLVVILGVFVIVAGGIWGYQTYLESTMPKGEEKFAKKRADGKPEEPAPSSLELLNELFSGREPSNEVIELQGKSAEEVLFSYDAIMKMTPAELEKNIKEVSDRLELKRSSLPPSIGGATAGSSGPPKEEASDPDKAAEEEVTVLYLALPLEVMRQVAKGNK